MVANAAVELVDSRLVKIRAGERGSGWAVGTHGVLTARHVVAPFLDKQVKRCLAVPDPAPDTTVFDCKVAWQDPQRDLALLAVDNRQLTAWRRAVGPGLGPPLAEPGTSGVAAEAVGYPNAAVEQNLPHPDPVLGWVKPAGGAISARMPFDVDGGVPGDSLLWQGMSGAAVRDRPHGRLLGVVVGVDADRQQRRLYVASLPDPAVDTAFAAALAEVGAEPILEAANAPAVRHLLAVWDRSGRPPAARQISQLDELGVRKARTDIDIHGDPYYPYVGRQLDREISMALDRRVSGTESRILLLVGEAMSGKSRTGAHALQTHPALSTRPLLVPQQEADLRDVTNLAPAGGAVLWLDDLNTFAAGLSPGVVRYWQSRPGIVVVATLRSDLLSQLQSNPDLRPAWTLIDNPDLVEQFVLPVEWSAADQQSLAGAEKVVRDKVADGIPLGEVLAAAEELRDRLAVADAFQKSLAFTVIDWSRTGMTVRIPEVLAEKIWIAYLSRKHTVVLQNKTREERHGEFLRAMKWACEAISGTAAMLITRNDDGLLAEDYLVAQRTVTQQVIADPLWQAALARAQATEGTATISNLAYNAATAGVLDIARAGWEPLATGNTGAAPLACVNLALVLKNTGDLEGARAAYQRAIDSHDPFAAPGAWHGLGVLLEEQGDADGARAAYQTAIDSGHQEHAPRAAHSLGILLKEQADADGARAAYQTAIDSGHQEYAPKAAFNLGQMLGGNIIRLLLKEQGDADGARAAYQTAIDSGHQEYAPKAAVYLGLLLQDQGDADGARAAYQTAIDSGHQEEAPMAASILGLLLVGQGDLAGARAAYQVAIDSGHREYAPMAAVELGALLQKEGDAAAARAAYQAAIDSGHPGHARAAAVSLGALLEEQGDEAGARAAYQAAIDSGHREYAPKAAVYLGTLLANQGDAAGARTAFQAAIDSGHQEYAPMAAVNLGGLLQKEGDAAGARTAFQTAIDSGHREYAPKAAVYLGTLLANQGDAAGARAAYQAAIDSGHREYAPAAAVYLGLLLVEQGDEAGARVAYQAAIDSGNQEYAPMAAVNLGGLLQKEGDAAAARAAYQAAIDSGDREYAPMAAVYLGGLLQKEGDAAAARAAYQAAIDSGHRDYAPAAAVYLGLLLVEQGDEAGARVAYQAAIDSGNQEYAPMAAVNLGALLQKEGDAAAARAAYQAAIDSGDREHAPMAAVNLGGLLQKEGDAAAARAAYQAAIDSGHRDYAPAAAFSLGLLLVEQGDAAGARAAYQAAIDSGHRDYAPAAAFSLGLLLVEQGDAPGARAAYQAAVDSGHQEYAPQAEFLFGEYCTNGDLYARHLHRENAAASGNANVLMSLAAIYAVEGDLNSAKLLLGKARNAGYDDADGYLALLAGNESGLASGAIVQTIRAAAEAGDTDSMNFLGLYALSKGSQEEAHFWWARSAAAGDMIAQLLIAHVNGNG